MTRCIHCTRCIRFSAEVAGVPDLGATGRGEDMEITTYLERAMTSELQGNVIDLCPVGALTSKPYEFQARPWELVKTESIDVMDAVGSAIRVDTRGREVMRILPRLNEAVNEEWISDKARFVWDGLKTQRLDRPYVRRDGRLVPVSWREAFAAVAEKMRNTAPNRVGVIAGDLASVEEMYALRSLFSAMHIGSLDCRAAGERHFPSFGRASYIFNPTIAGIDTADLILIVGSDPRHEAAVLNARLRKRWRQGDVRIGLIGAQVDLTYPYEYLGAGADSLAELASGKGAFGEALKAAKRPIVIVGSGAVTRADGPEVLMLAAKLATGGERDEGWNGLAVLHNARVARRRSRSRLRAAGQRPRHHRHGSRGRDQVAGRAVPARRRRSDHERAWRYVRRLHRHARRRRRAPRGRYPAGGGLHREVGHLRQHRRPRADGRRAPPSRRAMRARTGRLSAPCPMYSVIACRSIRSPNCGPGSMPNIRISLASMRSRRDRWTMCGSSPATTPRRATSPSVP